MSYTTFRTVCRAERGTESHLQMPFYLNSRTKRIEIRQNLLLCIIRRYQTDSAPSVVNVSIISEHYVKEDVVRLTQITGSDGDLIG